MVWEEDTVHQLAEEVSNCLAKGDASAATRQVFRFLERYDKSDGATRARITREHPETTGSDRYDALLAGIVECACASHGVVAPNWVNDQTYFWISGGSFRA